MNIFLWIALALAFALVWWRVAAVLAATDGWFTRLEDRIRAKLGRLIIDQNYRTKSEREFEMMMVVEQALIDAERQREAEFAMMLGRAIRGEESIKPVIDLTAVDLDKRRRY